MVYIIYSIVKRKIKVQLWRHSAQYSAAAPSYCFALIFSSTTMMAFVETSSGFIPLASCRLTEDVEVSKIKRDSEKMFQYYAQATFAQAVNIVVYDIFYLVNIVVYEILPSEYHI